MLASTAVGYGRRYRRWVLDSVRYLDVQDLTTSGDHIPELSEVYVDVALVSRAAHQAPGGPVSPAPAASAEWHSISELLERRSPVVLALIGQPGSGKSTLLAEAARRSAGTPALGRPGRRRVPILLALRQHAESIVSRPEISLPDVVREAVGAGPGKESGGWWERRLRRGRCLVMLDGLDEVARPDDRVAVTDWVRRQIAAYPRNHFTVTSRPRGLPEPLAEQADVYVVRPFTPDQVTLFLERWCLAAERRATRGSGRAAQRAVLMRARESAARLDSLLGQHPALRELAVNPLLLTMIATAHRYRGALPDGRADLYGEICHVLLSRRGQAKDLPELVSWPVKQALLATLAWQMMCDHAGALPSGRVLETLAPHLERFPPNVTGEAFLDDISRNGLLIESPAGGYAFAHQTFQEYLAARHVDANPALVQSLAEGVGDPWWHETILLYAETSDASPIVRACLESGTVPALTLAFDCADASIEIEPALRERLGLERRRAFEPDCPPGHRRVIAGVEAARLTRQTITTRGGARICALPVPAGLYWLFLTDTQAPRPDSPCDPCADQPATGIWGAEAHAFVTWLNSITATAAGIEVRLPRHDELSEAAIASALTARLPDSVTGVWTQPDTELWHPSGQPHPHDLTGAALRQVMAADAKNSAIVPQILNAAILNVALKILRDLDDIRALSGALADDLAARANSGGQAVDLMHAHARAIVLTYDHALDLTRAEAISRTCAAGPGLLRALDLADARSMAEVIAGDLARAIDQARARAGDLAEVIAADLSVLSAFDFDIDAALDLARAHVSDLDRVDLLARGMVEESAPGLARVPGLAGVPALDPGLPLPAILGLSPRWIADGPLAGTALELLTETPPSDSEAPTAHDDPYLSFARVLSSRAGIEDTTRLRAALGRPVTDALRDLEGPEPVTSEDPAGWYRVTGYSRLREACAPVYATRQSPGSPEAAALRVVALALADGAAAPGSGAPGVLRTVAATVTVVERRGKGETATGESIILALE